LLLAQFISYLLLNHEFKIWGFFFGLILSSGLFLYRQVNTLSSISIIYLTLGFLIASIISLTGPTSTPNNYFFVFFTGSIAICAMILPGISGSFILLLLSKYEYIINAIKDFKIDVLIVFAIGCIFGLLLFSRFLSFLFANYKNNVLSLLSGFLFGSLVKVWPFRTIIETRIKSDGMVEPFVTRPALPNINNIEEIIFFILFTLLGYFLIYFLQKKSIEGNKE
jgi:putative membrane protein